MFRVNNSPFLLLLFLLCSVLFLVIKLSLITYAYEKIGLSYPWVFFLLFCSLLGSSINIPLWQVTRPDYLSPYLGHWSSLTPLVKPPTITLAVNLGGAILPVGISLYLITTLPGLKGTMLATLVVAIIVHIVARPIPSVGMAIPTLIPGLCAALSALFFEKQAPAQSAYIAGSIGTLIGADLANLSQLLNLGVRIVSIGGAGTFDGIFLSGIMAVLLA